MEWNRKQIQAAAGILAVASVAATTAVGLYTVGKSISVLRKISKALDIYINEHKYNPHYSNDLYEDWDDEDVITF